ncbi:hypothetical protein CSKR_201292 [Clonorchis sinensis]|uniref:Uncharacterized protein n=1 Tax=Clonorchis sinensis TaxID=79923 RepID=A0A8T1MN98_CLOSI|nr:hypothetical protein CSKR_201292 [Clonorchis sinensis]
MQRFPCTDSLMGHFHLSVGRGGTCFVTLYFRYILNNFECITSKISCCLSQFGLDVRIPVTSVQSMYARIFAPERLVSVVSSGRLGERNHWRFSTHSLGS